MIQHSPAGTAQAPAAPREIIKEEGLFPPQYLPPAAHNICVPRSLPCQQQNVFDNPGQQSQQPVAHHICQQQDNLGALPADHASSTQTLAPHTPAPAAVLELGSPVARQPPACNPQATHLAAHSRSQIGQWEGAGLWHKCVFPHTPSAELGTACHSFQEPAFTQRGKSRTHQRPQSSLLLPWKHPSTHVARESQETATTRVIG